VGDTATLGFDVTLDTMPGRYEAMGFLKALALARRIRERWKSRWIRYD
jgi:hypothetical protein